MFKKCIQSVVADKRTFIRNLLLPLFSTFMFFHLRLLDRLPVVNRLLQACLSCRVLSRWPINNKKKKKIKRRSTLKTRASVQLTQCLLQQSGVTLLQPRARGLWEYPCPILREKYSLYTINIYSIFVPSFVFQLY